jgi:beta-alanine degradation protein BauB
MTRGFWFIVGLLIGAAVSVRVSGTGGPSTQDAVKLSPQYYNVKLENDRVRVLEFRFKPGDQEPMHTHGPYVVYFLSDGTIRATAPDGTPSESTIQQGQTAWRDSAVHATENIGRTELHALIVELKLDTR